MTIYRQKVPTVDAIVYSPSNPIFQPFLLTEARLTVRGFTEEDLCPICGIAYVGHAWMGDDVDGIIIHPGQYVINPNDFGVTSYVMDAEDFLARWELQPAS